MKDRITDKYEFTCLALGASMGLPVRQDAGMLDAHTRKTISFNLSSIGYTQLRPFYNLKELLSTPFKLLSFHEDTIIFGPCSKEDRTISIHSSYKGPGTRIRFLTLFSEDFPESRYSVNWSIPQCSKEQLVIQLNRYRTYEHHAY